MFGDASAKRLKELLTQADLRLTQAVVEHVGAVYAKLAIEKELIMEVMRSQRVYCGSRVMVDFREGREECIFEGVDGDEYNGVSQLLIRHLTKAGKPRKHVHRYGVSYLDAITAKPVDK